MATYIILNTVFFAAIVAALSFTRQLAVSRRTAIVLAVLLVTTAIFDSLIISAGIVAYDETRILGIRIATAPIEDFYYAIVAAVVVPSVWTLLEKVDDDRKA